MPEAKFSGYWAKEIKLKKGFVPFEIDYIFFKKLKPYFIKLAAAEKKTGKRQKLDFIVNWHGKKGSLDQLALIWSLFEVEANEINGGDNYAQGSITKEKLYKQDLMDFAERIIMIVSAESLPRIRTEYRHIIEFREEERNGVKKWYIEALESLSMMSMIKRSEFIERIFNRIAENGVSVSKSADILQYWAKFNENLNDTKTILHDEDMTEAQYKALYPSCQACGDYLGNGGGSLAHIKARGMGGNPEDFKQKPANWLHLCDSDHHLFDNGAGWVEFLKKYRWLKYKVERALRQKVERIETNLPETETNLSKSDTNQAESEQDEPGGKDALPIF